MTPEQIQAVEQIQANWNETDAYGDPIPQTTFTVVAKYNRLHGETLGYINGDMYEAQFN